MSSLSVHSFWKRHTRTLTVFSLLVLNFFIYGIILDPMIDLRAEQLIEMRGLCLCPEDGSDDYSDFDMLTPPDPDFWYHFEVPDHILPATCSGRE